MEPTLTRDIVKRELTRQFDGRFEDIDAIIDWIQEPGDTLEHVLWVGLCLAESMRDVDEGRTYPIETLWEMLETDDQDPE